MKKNLKQQDQWARNGLGKAKASLCSQCITTK